MRTQVSSILLASVVATTSLLAQESNTPPQPTKEESEQLITDGDRLADQADYSGALEKYTQAYHTIVSEIRGHKFRKRVLPSLMTREELGQEMLRQIEKEYTPEELALIDASYKVLGLMPRELKTAELMTKLLTEEVGGFYDPDNKRMVLIRENGSNKDPGFLGRLLGAKPAFDKQEQKTVLAHEMTHALQDQLHDLNAMQKAVENDDDMLLAFSALVEGEATLLMFSETGDGQDITKLDVEAMRSTFQIMSWMMPIAGGSAYRKAPAIFRESLIFPYLHGMLFNLGVANQDGWSAIDRAFARPPASTEQILHPDKYAEGPAHDAPSSVQIPDLASYVPSDFKHLGGNCLGEFQISVMLKKVKSGARASAGWDGDRYEVFERADGTLALAFVSTWDSEQDAQEFADAYRTYREPAKRARNAKTKGSSDEAQAPNDKDSDGQTKPTTAEAQISAQVEEEKPKTPGWPFGLVSKRVVEVDNDRVIAIEGFDDATNQKLLPVLRMSKVSEKSFPMPKDRDIPR